MSSWTTNQPKPSRSLSGRRRASARRRRHFQSRAICRASPAADAMASQEWVTCPNGCGEKLFHKEVSQHVRATCPDRKEVCDCGAHIRYRERNKHKLLFCDLRQVQCKYAPRCKWRGTARDMQVHISESLSTAQKMAKVKGDPFIECLERPYTCWHPPLVAPAEDDEPDGFKLRWSGCGAVFPFGKRAVHDSKECPFRQQLCKLGCGQKVCSPPLSLLPPSPLFSFARLSSRLPAPHALPPTRRCWVTSWRSTTKASPSNSARIRERGWRAAALSARCRASTSSGTHAQKLPL